jgi:hypothetical protein
MPCSDVTEILSLTVDSEDRVVHYSLSKLTCGGAVGNPSVLRKWIEGKTANEILETQLHDVLALLPTASTTWELVTLKHLRAVQLGLEALTGQQNAGAENACAIESVEATPNRVRMIALIRVEAKTEQIQACGGCGCG